MKTPVKSEENFRKTKADRGWALLSICGRQEHQATETEGKPKGNLRKTKGKGRQAEGGQCSTSEDGMRGRQRAPGHRD